MVFKYPRKTTMDCRKCRAVTLHKKKIWNKWYVCRECGQERELLPRTKRGE